MNPICCVCLDYNYAPKSLPCLHVICLSCLKKLVHHRVMISGDSAPGTDQFLTVICPVCRHKFITSEEKVGDFPSPRICKQCKNYVEQVVQMSCGHRNEDLCFNCLQYDSKEQISCPDCAYTSTKIGLQRMYLCSECHQFTTKLCISCYSNLIRMKLKRTNSRYFVDEMFPDIDRGHNKPSWLTIFMLMMLIVGPFTIITNHFSSEDSAADDEKNLDNVCCSITVWHVDRWGNVDTTWCSGDDWKMTNAECTVWPP